MESIRAYVEKLWELIRHYTKYGIKALKDLSNYTWKLIYGVLAPCCRFILQKVDQAFCSLKAYYDNLSERLKDSLVRAKKKIVEMGSNIAKW